MHAQAHKKNLHNGKDPIRMTRDGSSRKSRSGSAHSVLFWTSRCLAEPSRAKWSCGSTRPGGVVISIEGWRDVAVGEGSEDFRDGEGSVEPEFCREEFV